MLRMHVSTFMTVVIFVTCLASACGDSTPTAPSTGALVTFAVASETFRVSLTSSDQVAAARDGRSGGLERHLGGGMVLRSRLACVRGGYRSSVKRQGAVEGGLLLPLRDDWP